MPNGDNGAQDTDGEQHSFCGDEDVRPEITELPHKARVDEAERGVKLGKGKEPGDDADIGDRMIEDYSSCDDIADSTDVDDGLAPWIRSNFPFVRNDDDTNDLLSQSRLAVDETKVVLSSLSLPLPSLSQNCEECAARQIAVSCRDCLLSFCWRCADAIHILPEFANHNVQLARGCVAIDKYEGTPSVKSFTHQEKVVSIPPTSPINIVDLNMLSTGSSVLFRAPDCGRWPQELLHGVVVNSTSVSAVGSDGRPGSFCRVLWLRGVEALANGSFRANLVLPSSPSHQIAPVIPLDVFPSRLAALRAVATAEALARRSRRHTVASAILHQVETLNSFPTPHQITQIRDSALEIVGQRAMEFRLFQPDDERFFADLAAGQWNLSNWLGLALGESIVGEWEDEGLEPFITNEHHLKEDWPPPKSQLVRFFTLEVRDLRLPELERSEQLRHVVNRLLFVYMGFAWARWRKFVRRHRERQHKELRVQSATAIQRWSRRRWDRQNRKIRVSDQSMLAMALSMDEIEQVYRKRQNAAQSLFLMLKAQWEKRLTRSLHNWAQAAQLSDPAVQRRIARVQHNPKWHPSYGMNGVGEGILRQSRVPLPTRLPRVFARASPDGRVVAEDVARYQQFRATHSGPTAASYWLLRGRVLLGAHPRASSHVVKGKRAGGAILSGGAPAGVGKDPITSILLEQVNAFVCLMGARELEDFERQIEGQENNSLDKNELSRARKQSQAIASAEMSTRWGFEKLVRQRYDALMAELRAGKKRADRQLELALRSEVEAAEALGACQASRRSTQEDVMEAEQAVEMAVARSDLARQHAVTAGEAVTRLEMRLVFTHLPIQYDGIPGDGEHSSCTKTHLDTEPSVRLVKELEEWIRAGHSLFVFSKDGHGRTGLVGALLFGRLYGLSASEALERVQRHHDCQSRYHPSSTSTISIPASPHSARQVALVRAALALTTDAMYAGVTRENPEEEFLSRRTTKRGLLGAPLLAADGGLVYAEPDETQRTDQLNELKDAQRIATREAAAQRLQRNRRKAGKERETMAGEDENIQGEEEIEVQGVLFDMVRRL